MISLIRAARSQEKFFGIYLLERAFGHLLDGNEIAGFVMDDFGDAHQAGPTTANIFRAIDNHRPPGSNDMY